MQVIEFESNVGTYLRTAQLTHFSEPVFAKFHPSVVADIENVPINFKLRGMSRNGVYQHGSKAGPFGVIKLNKALSVEDANLTFLHELAHVIERFAFGTRGHGWRWKSIMRALGQKPERTNNRPSMKTYIESKPHRWHYTCRDCGHLYKTYRRLKNASLR